MLTNMFIILMIMIPWRIGCDFDNVFVCSPSLSICKFVSCSSAQGEHWWQKCWWLGDCACKPADVETPLPIASSPQKNGDWPLCKIASNVQRARERWKWWSRLLLHCWSWLSSLLTVGRAAPAGNSGWLPITTQQYKLLSTRLSSRF